jgi:lysophospholipase L1-like esterase
MKRTLALLALLLLTAAPAHAFDILSIGTSATNGHGVDRGQAYPARLQEMLRRDGFAEATVINAGIDGDRPAWMFKRLPAALTPATRLVIVEPGPNDPDNAYALQYAEKMLALLRERGLPTIYISSRTYQPDKDAAAMAAKYGAVYYGTYSMGVPRDSKYWLGDNEKQFGGSGKGWGGHMSAEGCLLVAQGLAPVVEQTLAGKAGITPKR